MKFYNKQMKLFTSLILFSVSVLGFSQTTPPQYFHDTKGNADVNGAGQLQFTVPIDVPPGVKDIAPKIDIVYTSGSGNGVVGYGGSIAGITSISRVGKNIEKDGEMKGVQLDYSDFYSFNGQRLILKSGEYGKDGAEYTTEKFSNTKIKSLGSISGQTWSGPEYWEVTLADGSQAWYGATTSGNSNARTPLEYNIVKWKDVHGNYITYNYIQDTGTNVALISSIKWGGNETLGKTHFNEIVFNYNGASTRGLIEQSFVNGISLLQDKILNNIIVKTNNSQYRKYDIIYKLDSTKYQFVEKIQEYNAENQPANPIEFSRTEFSPNSSSISSYWDSFPTPVLTGDFHGSHSMDFILKNPVGTVADGYYLRQGNSDRYLGTENIYDKAIPLTIKDASGYVSSKHGIASYSIDPTTKDITLKYYQIDFTKPANVNSLFLVGTKVIPFAQWNETEHTSTTNPLTFYDKTSSINKLVQYDMDGDGVPEVLIEKTIRITNTTCPSGGGELDPEGRPINCQANSYTLTKYIVVKQQDNSFPYFEFYSDKSENLVIGDFNGDGLDDIGQSSPYWGSTVDGEFVPANLLQGFNIKKDDQGNYNSIEIFSADYLGLSSTVQTADFNGDGILDLFTRTNVNNHYMVNLNTGKQFVKTPYFNDFYSTEGYSSSQNGNYSTVKVLDINADGKSDIINFSSNYNIASPTSASSNITIKVGENQGYLNGKIQFNANQPVTFNAAMPLIFRELIGLRQNQLYIYTPFSNNQGEGSIHYYNHYSNLQKFPVERIKQGELRTLINYIDGYGYNLACTDCYKPVKNEQYPLMELANTNSKLVSRIYESTNQANVSRFKEFRYRGLIVNLHNKKTVGFRQIASSQWNSAVYPGYALFNTHIWSGTERDPLNEGVPVKEWSIRTNDESIIFPTDISENNTQLLAFKSTTYQTNKLLNGQVVTTVPNADKAKVVTAILPTTTKEKDFLTGTLSESTITYGQYYLPSQSVSKINGNYAVTTSTYEYNSNPSGIGASYYMGRPTSKTEIVQAYGDTKGGKEEFTYENNAVKTIKKWNRDNTGYLLDTFTYDGFGNITQKVSSNSVDSQTETTASSYDTTGRFVITKTDNLGLVTGISYDQWGQVLTQTDPLGNTVTNTYDSWGKLLTSTSNLGGTTTYSYDKDSNSNIIITQSAPNGNVSKTFTNTWGQIFKNSTKAFGQGQYVSQDVQFDLLGRKIKESEPYFEGQSASQWNTIAYDDSVYPTKVTTTAFTGKQTTTTISGLTTTIKEVNGNGRTTTKTVDALGNVVSTTDKGGTITFAYNAAGQQTQAKYGENTVATKYDVWGRKSEFNDPSNGIYTYEFNGFGQPKKTISPKGTKEYTYNSLGQLISQQEFSTVDNGQSTNKNTTYTYNNKGILTARSAISEGQAFTSNLTYDPQGRLLSSIENSNGKTYSEKAITYDEKGRVISYEKELLSAGVSTKVIVENVYSTWNGELYQIKDKKTGKILWELKETNAKGQALRAKLGAVDMDNSYDPNGFLAYVNQSSAVKPNLLRLSYSFDALKNELKFRKTEGDFAIEEYFDYDDNNRLINWTNPVTGVKPSSNRNVYDIKGRITANDEVGTIKFENSAKIYQPTGMTLNTAGTQNYNGDLIQTITYNENNDPVQINGEKARISFKYGLGSARQRINISKLKDTGIGGGGGEPPVSGFSTEEDWDAPVWQVKLSKFYNEDGSFEVVRNQSTNEEKHIIYIEGSPYESNIVYLKDFAETNGSYKFLHKDYIGSVLAISDEAGNKLEQRHFDAWGNFTHLKIANGPVVTDKAVIAGATLLVDRGYTSHEHFMDVGIIHMNGRLYDPLLRRFLNADENIQDPTNTQNYNKYGYVMNNPMMYNDPDGEFWWWLAGAIAGSYISGVQANHGNMNPFKWDWENTWSAVLGGGIAGAAVGGGIQNISISGPKFIENSVAGLAGSIFNGLATGQSVFTSALGGISGFSYSFDIDSRITSTKVNSSSSYRSTGGSGETFEDYLYSIGVPTYGTYDIEGVTVKGRKGDSSYNSYMMGLGINNAAGDWNLSQRRTLLYDQIENTKVGQSVSAAENFLFLELPGSLVGGEFLSAGWRAVGAGKFLSGVANNVYARVAPRILVDFSETTAEQVAVHGNSLRSLRPTWGYKLYSVDGTFLKNGITSQIEPELRYTQKFMRDKYMEAIKFPNRKAAWDWEYQQNLILKGPLNKNMH
jgi:RHS repeat-associated protein